MGGTVAFNLLKRAELFFGEKLELQVQHIWDHTVQENDNIGLSARPAHWERVWETCFKWFIHCSIGNGKPSSSVRS